MYTHQKLNRTMVVLAVLSFLLMGFLALFCFSVPMDGDMDSSHCPFMSGSSVCNMGPLDHVSAWHSVFSNIVNEFSPSALILLVACIVISFFVSILFTSPPKIIGKSPRYVFDEGRALLNTLQVAYSKGILNPKLF